MARVPKKYPASVAATKTYPKGTVFLDLLGPGQATSEDTIWTDLHARRSRLHLAMHALQHLGALRHVRRDHLLGEGRASGIWCE